MNRRYINLIVILIVLAAAIWIVQPNNPGIKLGDFNRSLKTVLGLDLQGGLQVLLEADLPADQDIEAESMETARQVLENRANGLGVSEVVFQVAGTRRIVGEFPGLTNTEEVIAVLRETGRLEFVDVGDTYMEEGTPIKTDGGNAQVSEPAPASADPAAEQAAATPDPDKVYHTIMTGDQIKEVGVVTSSLGEPEVSFILKDEGAKIFGDFTSANVNKYLAIVLDNKVISCPIIKGAITGGEGSISGNFTVDTANNLAVTLRYGSLPIPLKVIESRVIGPTLGQDSLNKSLLAGVIGFIIVALFMIIYYRMPGLVAVVSIAIYAVVTLAVFKLIPVTLTLPGIAGFLLSTGGALDANILIFERFREELRNGRTLAQAVDLGWKRARSSIFDSNIATIITSAILFIFGSQFGATIVKGFALTLALGVVISLCAAVFISRPLLQTVIGIFKPEKRDMWYGA